MANQERIIAAETENLKAKLGQELLPVYRDLLHVASDIIHGFDDIPDSVKQSGTALLELAAAGGPIALLIIKLRDLRAAMIGAGLLTPVTAAAAAIGAGIYASATSVADSMNTHSDRQNKDAGMSNSQTLAAQRQERQNQIAYLERFQKYLQTPTDTSGFAPKNNAESGYLTGVGATFDPQTGNAMGDAKRVAAAIASLRDEQKKLVVAGLNRSSTEAAGAFRQFIADGKANGQHQAAETRQNARGVGA